MSAVNLDFEITLRQTHGTTPETCQGCGCSTDCLLSMEGCGDVLTLIAVCSECQWKLVECGHVIETAEVQRVEAEVAKGRSVALATRIARRWGSA